MRFLNHDINKRLLVLIIVFFILFSAVTAYYQYKFTSILNKKTQNDEKISEITAQLILERYNKIDKSKETEIELVDKLILEQRYDEVKAQNEKLKKEVKDISALKDEINILKSQIEYHKARLEGPVAQFRLIQEKNEQITQLKENIDDLCSMLKQNKLSYEECG